MKLKGQIMKLGEVCDFQGGSQPPKSEFIYEYRKGYVRFLQIRDFASDNYITYIPESKKNRYCDEDDVLLGRYGASVGKVLINKAGAYNVAVMKTIPDRSLLDKRYLFYYLNSNEFQERLLKTASRSAQDGFSKDDIFDFPIFIPSISDQRKLVKAMDKAFAAIDKAKANTEKNLQNVRELFESYLEGVFVNDVENWIEMKLKDIGVTQTGTTPKTGEKENFGNYIPFIKPADVDFSGIGDIRYDNDGLSEIGLRKGRRIECGSILMVCIGATIGKVGFSEHAVSCNQQINTLTVRKGIEPKFIYFAMTSKMFQDKVLAEGKGAQATLPIINKSKWESLTIKIPVRQSEQQSFLKKLDDLQLEVKKMEIKYKAKLAYLIELRTSILQKAFSGEL